MCISNRWGVHRPEGQGVGDSGPEFVVWDYVSENISIPQPLVAAASANGVYIVQDRFGPLGGRGGSILCSERWP